MATHPPFSIRHIRFGCEPTSARWDRQGAFLLILVSKGRRRFVDLGRKFARGELGRRARRGFGCEADVHTLDARLCDLGRVGVE